MVMTAKLDRVVMLAFGGLLALLATTAWAAKAPLSSEELKKQASHIVSGTVVEVTSHTRKSKVEKAWGIHRDRVFRIKLKVTTVSQGTGINAGDEILLTAWQPSMRIPPLPGLQGHESIPQKGDSVTVYVKGHDGDAFEPLLPNGIVIAKGKEQYP